MKHEVNDDIRDYYPVLHFRTRILEGGGNLPRVKSKRVFDAASHGESIVLVNAILLRGNFAQSTNVAGIYRVTELEIE